MHEQPPTCPSPPAPSDPCSARSPRSAREWFRSQRIATAWEQRGTTHLKHLRESLRLVAVGVRRVLPNDPAPLLVDVVEDPRVNLVVEPVDILFITHPNKSYPRRVVSHRVLSLFVCSTRNVHNVNENVSMSEIIQELPLTSLPDRTLFPRPAPSLAPGISPATSRSFRGICRCPFLQCP